MLSKTEGDLCAASLTAALAALQLSVAVGAAAAAQSRVCSSAPYAPPARARKESPN